MGLMPRDELRYQVYVYECVSFEKRYIDLILQELHKAEAVSQRANVSPLTPRDVEELTAAISQAKGQTEYLVELLNLCRKGIEFVQHHDSLPPASKGRDQ